MKEAKIQYDAMLENGDLEILFPSLSGEWKKDKKKFELMWAENKKLIDETEVRQFKEIKSNN